MHDVMQLYQQKIGPISSGQRDKLYQIYDEGMSPFVIGCAILRTSQEQNRRNLQGKTKRISFNYLWGIIQDWMVHAINSESAFKAYWEGQGNHSSAHGKGGQYAKAQGGRQVFDQDYRYSEREPAAQGFFAFLDDEIGD